MVEIAIKIMVIGQPVCKFRTIHGRQGNLHRLCYTIKAEEVKEWYANQLLLLGLGAVDQQFFNRCLAHIQRLLGYRRFIIGTQNGRQLIKH